MRKAKKVKICESFALKMTKIMIFGWGVYLIVMDGMTMHDKVVAFFKNRL